MPDAWLGGLSDTYSLVQFDDRYACFDLELTPLGAYVVLGRPLSELAGAVVAFEDLFGQAGRELAERLRELREWDQRFDLLEAFLLDRAAKGPRATPAVAWAWERLVATDGSVRIETLAAELGCSRRYLLSKFGEQVGAAPKTVARLLRFAHAARRLAADPPKWAEIAYQAGYSDQSHLNRDFPRPGGDDSDGVLGAPRAGRRTRRGRMLPGLARQFPFLQHQASVGDLSCGP